MPARLDNNAPANQIPLCFAIMMVLSWAFYIAVAGACQICVPYPKTTLADRLLQGKTVIMARERNDKAYTFYPVEILKGSIDADDFSAFIDAASRRMLRQQPDNVVVLSRENSDSDWQYVAYADLDYQEFIRSILQQSAQWLTIRGDRDRIDFFAERLNHADQKIKEQAYLEVGRAPYASIKRIAGTVPRQHIRGFLDQWRLIEWHSLYILMLGQSRHPDDLFYIRKQMELAATLGSKTNLSAWVTAFIETNPETGVEEIENLYFSNKNRKPNELKEACIGLSVLGSEVSFRYASELVDRRHRIVRSYGTLLENHPMMAGLVAKDLTVWQIRAYEKRLAQISKDMSALDPVKKMAINYYLSISHRFQRVETVQ